LDGQSGYPDNGEIYKSGGFFGRERSRYPDLKHKRLGHLSHERKYKALTVVLMVISVPGVSGTVRRAILARIEFEMPVASRSEIVGIT
jgi:hypothetical protein